MTRRSIFPFLAMTDGAWARSIPARNLSANIVPYIPPPPPPEPTEEDREFATAYAAGQSTARLCACGKVSARALVSEFKRLQLKRGACDSLPIEFLVGAVEELSKRARRSS